MALVCASKRLAAVRPRGSEVYLVPMELVYIVAAALAGASATWVFGRLNSRTSAKKGDYDRVVAARHEVLEAAQALQFRMIQPSQDTRSDLLAATQGINRLSAMGDVANATRAMQWLLAMVLKDADLIAEAQAEFITHVNDPLT